LQSLQLLLLLFEGIVSVVNDSQRGPRLASLVFVHFDAPSTATGLEEEFMTDRHKTHNGRDLGGHYGARQEDVDDILTDVAGTDIIREEVRHDGAVADTGIDAGANGHKIAEMIDENREDVRRVAGKGDVEINARVRKD
jgi:hypothetical protein